MFGRQRKLVALFGQPRQFLMGTEIIGRERQRLLPARDSFSQRPVDILERFGGGCVARLAQTVEDPACDHRLLGFITQKCVLERDVRVAGIETHRLGKLAARGLGFTGLEQGIRQVFADGGALRRKRNRPLKRGHRLVIIVGAKRCVGLLQLCVCWICDLADGDDGRGQ